jgi:hypothetical protein
VQAKCPIGAIPLQLAAEKLAERGIATGGHKIFKQLRNLGMLNGLHPSKHAIDMCWLEERPGHWERGRMDKDYCRVFITLSGLDEAEHELKAAGEVVVVEPPVVVSDIDLGVGERVVLGF